jgi:hypothetical protein
VAVDAVRQRTATDIGVWACDMGLLLHQLRPSRAVAGGALAWT